MVAFRFVVSSIMSPSLLIDGVVVEKDKQLGMDDYYEANYEASYTPVCPKDDVNQWKLQVEDVTAAHPENANNKLFAQKAFTDTENQSPIVAALKVFLFDRITDDSVPKLFAATGEAGLQVSEKNGDAKKLNSCSKWENWAPIRYADDPAFVCDDCGYDMKDADGPTIIQDIVKFANLQNGNTQATVAMIPKLWCHNPYPQMLGKINGKNIEPLHADENKDEMKTQWRGTGGYYNVLKCKDSKYSVIGFAAEKKGTCYPFHIHNSYELYWPIAGKANWTAHDKNLVPVRTFPEYKIGDNSYYLHKHNANITHEIVTPDDRTTQVYFWSMTGSDGLTENHYDADFGTDKNGNGKTEGQEKLTFPDGSCYKNAAFAHIGKK